MLKKLIKKLKRHISEKGDILNASDLLEMLVQVQTEEVQNKNQKDREVEKLKTQNGW